MGELPLVGIRVVALEQAVAAPLCTRHLADLGADVVKIERPGEGDFARGYDTALSGLSSWWVCLNGGKRSVTVNLKSNGGRAVFRRLLGTADVLLENFRPGVLARLGFGWEELRRDHPGLVYCAVSGFGATGPESDRPAYDQVVQGLSGIMSVTGSEDTAPLRVGYPVCDSIGGLAAAFAISSALVRKARTGEGAYLDVSMLDAALSTMGWVVSDYLVAGRTPEPMGNENRTSAPSGTFETGDGALNIAANKQEQWLALCTAIGRDELTTDPRFATRDDRKHHRVALKDELERTLRRKPASHWDAVLRRAGVPAAPVATVPEALDSPQVRHRGLVGRVESAAGPLDLLGLPTHVDGDAVPPPGPPPVLGEHTDEVLREAGLTDADIEALRSEGAL